jgi:adenine phosphoribosyltransferase
MSLSKDLDLIVKSFENVPVIDVKDYRYFVHPLSDGIRSIEPEILLAFSRTVSSIIRTREDIDLLITAEAMGIPITTTVSLETGIPFSIVRKRRYGINGELQVHQSTGYSSSDLFLNIPSGTGSIVVIDDVLSTGGTLKAISKGIRETEASIDCSILLFNKMSSKKNELERELGFPIITILDIEMMGEGVAVRTSDGICEVNID